MGIWAEIKKSINSNLNKPLDITLGEIQNTVDKARVAHRKIEIAYGVPYNATDNAQVLTVNDSPIVSISGAGRILQVIPVSTISTNGMKNGTVLLSVDNEIVFNARVSYCTSVSDLKGYYILTNTDNHKRSYMYCDVFSATSLLCVDTYPFLRTNPSDNFANIASTLIEPLGLPFNDGFEIRLSQSAGGGYIDSLGVIVIYELYE